MKRTKKTLILDLTYEGSQIAFVNEVSNLIQKGIAITESIIILVTIYSTVIKKQTIEGTISLLGQDFYVSQDYQPYQYSKNPEKYIDAMNKQIQNKYFKYVAEKTKPNSNYQIKYDDNNQLNFKIDSESAFYVRKTLSLNENEPITQEHLNLLTDINISVFNNTNYYYLSDMELNWLNHCPNLKRLSISLYETNQINKLKAIDSIPSLEYFEIKRELIEQKLSELNYGIDLNNENFGFLKNSPNLKEINLDASFLSIRNNLLQDLNHPYNLILSNFRSYSTEIDLSDIGCCESITFNCKEDGGPYDIATAMSKEKFEKLLKKEIPIFLNINKDNNIESYTLKELENIVYDIYDSIDKEYSNIAIDENDDEITKTKKVISYVIQKLEYSDKIKTMLNSQNKNTQSLDEAYNNLCYNGGLLYAALNDNGEAICGTYAAFTNVLLNKAGIHSRILSSPGHAWNLVRVNDIYYYVDATYMDGNDINLDKLLFPPINENIYEAYNLPIFEQVYQNANYDFTSQIKSMMQIYKITQNDTTYMLSNSAYLTLLIALGFAIPTELIKKKDYELYNEKYHNQNSK